MEFWCNKKATKNALEKRSSLLKIDSTSGVDSFLSLNLKADNLARIFTLKYWQTRRSSSLIFQIRVKHFYLIWNLPFTQILDEYPSDHIATVD